MAQTVRSEYEGCLSVRDGQLMINMSARNLDDTGVVKWCSWVDDCLEDFVKLKRLQRNADGFLVCKEANFATNMLGDRGGFALLRVLFNHQIAVRIIKLFKNHLGRAFASSLMDWLTHTPVPAVELHLSHNYIPREGAVDILKAVAHNPVYPAEHKGGNRQPLWLRLEQNIVEKPDELLKVAEEHLAKIRQRSKRGEMLSLCSVPRSIPPDAPCPLAQVAYLTNQRDLRVRVPTEAQQWKTGQREAIRWRVSISTEEAEKQAKAPVSKSRPVLTRENTVESSEAPDEPQQAPPVRESTPVWNGLPASEQLQAAKKAPPQSVPPRILARGEDLERVPQFLPEGDSDSDSDSDEAPGSGPPLQVGGMPPFNYEAPSKAPPVKMPPPAGYAAALPPVKAPPMKSLAPPEAKAPPAQEQRAQTASAHVPPPPSEKPPPPLDMPPAPPELGWTPESAQFLPFSLLSPAADLPVINRWTDKAQVLPEVPLISPGLLDIDPKAVFCEVTAPPGLGLPQIDPKQDFCDLPPDFDVATLKRLNVPNIDDDSEDDVVAGFHPVLGDSQERHTSNPNEVPDDFLKLATERRCAPETLAREKEFQESLFKIKEKFLELGSEEFMRRLQL
mmetsp:Transcript_116520/g.276985  ORF Transcript_116520/g.276985 Transcript_116520/m.276985 type:complete len:617 (-) Transcript_116520:42-1892(-)